MKKELWHDELPVVGRMKPAQAAAKLRELGDEETAAALLTAEATKRRPEDFGMLDGLFAPKPWQHTAHAFGHIAPAPPGDVPLPIRHAGNMAADTDLKNSRLNITLSRLRVAAYPGGGMHRVLFDFYAQNHLAGATEDLHFNATYRIREGEQAGVIGYPIFLGLNVGTTGVAFRCFTVNVKNDQDEAFLGFLESDVFKAGLKLATVAQPALAPFSQMALSVTKTIAQRNRNVPVQDFFLGLDFSHNAMGARLAEGDYIVVQIPESMQSVWNWSGWVYTPETGHIVSKKNPQESIPFNYVVIGVGRYEG